MGLEERLDKIEIKLAFLEDFLLRLQDEVVAVRAAQDRQEAERQAIKERLLQISRDLAEEPLNQKPPHY